MDHTEYGQGMQLFRSYTFEAYSKSVAASIACLHSQAGQAGYPSGGVYITPVVPTAAIAAVLLWQSATASYAIPGGVPGEAPATGDVPATVVQSMVNTPITGSIRLVLKAPFRLLLHRCCGNYRISAGFRPAAEAQPPIGSVFARGVHGSKYACQR